MSSHFSLSKYSKQRSAFSYSVGGFGLIELMVSISIMILVTTVILTRHTSFNGAVLLRSQAYEIALALRDIQLSAVSAVSIESQYRSQLGIYFNSSQGLNKTYRIFNDNNEDGYQSGEEFGLQGFIDSRFEITSIRTQNGTTITGSGLSIVFQRPNFDAKFYSAGTEIVVPSVNIDITRVGAQSGSNSDTRRIEVSSTGQIAVCSQIDPERYGCGG